jgi:hypothetical protein
MNRDELRIRELEREILETDACICEVRAKVRWLSTTDPARAGASTLIERLLEGRTAAYNALSALVQGVELRPMQH